MMTVRPINIYIYMFGNISNSKKHNRIGQDRNSYDVNYGFWGHHMFGGITPCPNIYTFHSLNEYLSIF